MAPNSPLPPDTTPVPVSPLGPVIRSSPSKDQQQSSSSKPSPSRPDTDKDKDKDAFQLPKLRLEIRDLAHSGTTAFLSAVHAAQVTTKALRSVLRHLYGSPSTPSTTSPPVRSVTLVLRDMGGVAYTTGSELDPELHKEIHFSLPYIARIPASRVAEEIEGVITHELVHCVQYNGFGSCPGGLIEGIADWVRLQCDLAPPHWKREAGGKWNSGYQVTGYFLEYLEGRFGEGTVRRLNEKLRLQRYEEKKFWMELLGKGVDDLWREYGEKLKDEEPVVVNKEDISGDENGRKAKGSQS